MTEDTPEAWEQIRRSVAMLTPGAWALRREQALEALTALINALHRQQATDATIDDASESGSPTRTLRP